MVTLDRLVNVLGSYGVRLRFCPIPRSTELRSVVMHELTEDRTVVGDVLLGIGARSVKEAVRWAASARAVVVLIRGGDDDDTAFSGAAEGVAVMVVDPAMSWSELAAVIYGLVLEGRETESGRGPTDLFALADSLAEATGGAVIIEDRLSRVLAYSRRQQHADPARVATIVERQAPEQLRAFFDARGVYTHLAASDEPLFVTRDPDHGMTGRMVVAVRSGRELMGSVWVECRAPLDGAALTALADGARTVALHLLRSRASADLERQVESELVIRLLEGTADAATAASRLGLPHTLLRVIAVQAFIGAERDAALLLAFERATTGFGWSRPGPQRPGRQHRLHPAARRGGGHGATLGYRSAGGAARTDDGIGRHQRGRRGGRPRRGTPRGRRVSGAARGMAYRRHASGLRRVLGRHPAAAAAHRGALRSVPGPGTGGRAAPPRPRAGNRIRADAAGLAGGPGRPAEAGNRLGVHENTVRYRLRKMAEITNLQLDDAKKRLAMMIELAATDTD